MEQGVAGLSSCGLQLLEAAGAQALGVLREQLGGKAGSRKKSSRRSQSAISPWATGHVSMFEFVG